MRAFAIDEFGGAGTIRELPDPEPAEGEVLVRVKAAGVSATDLAVIAGYMAAYFEHVFPLVPGIDASGVVERVGPGVEGYREGDEVYGYVRKPVYGQGTMAELVAMPIRGVERKPDAFGHEQTAVIPHCALTAIAAVDAAAVQPAGRMVLLGATGGVGSFATQLATAAGVHVIAVTRSEYADYARSLGAAEVIEYDAAEPVGAIVKRCPMGVEAVVDFVGIPELTAGMATLARSGGRVVSIVIPPDTDALAARGVQGILATRFAGEDRFPELAARIAAGEIRIPAVQTFPFEAAADGLALQATQHVHGKLALLVA
jgi:NADPH:quinone reductase-like Zn-dependent oxidoreductase